MGQVTADAERTIAAPVKKVRELVADYATVRREILTEHYRDYRVLDGGVGSGTQVGWTLQATSKRSRDVLASVTEPEPGTLVETDQNSTMVTTWTVRESGAGSVVPCAPPGRARAASADSSSAHSRPPVSSASTTACSASWTSSRRGRRRVRRVNVTLGQ